MTNPNFFNQVVSPWMKQAAPEDDIVISTRIRLARNFHDKPFPTGFSEEESKQIVQTIETKFAEQSLSGLGKFELVRMNNLALVEKQVLIEKHLISPDLAEKSHSAAVLISENEAINILVNEEDHMRIQCLAPGLQLQAAFETASKIDDWLAGEITFAYDEQLGYLTSCPSNIGTGLRASVMLHLPAITSTGQIESVIQSVNKMGLMVRGVYGEGSQSMGNLFQISNQVTLGHTEATIIEDLERAVQQIISYERQIREANLKQERIQLEDHIFRSKGILENARRITAKEATGCLSRLRVGIDLGLVGDISKEVFNELMVAIQPGCLQHFAGKQLTPEVRDVERATMIRKKLQNEKERDVR